MTSACPAVASATWKVPATVWEVGRAVGEATSASGKVGDAVREVVCGLRLLAAGDAATAEFSDRCQADHMRARLLIGALVVLGLAWSWSSGPYSDLASRYGAKAPFTGTPIESSTLVVVGPQHRGASNYRGIIRTSVGSGALQLEGRGLASPFLAAVQIPRDAVRFCAKTCFGGSKWEADVVLTSPAVKLQFENAQEVIDWCWAERVPILPSAAERDWLYTGAALPDPAGFETQFANRSAFDEAVHKSCVGS